MKYDIITFGNPMVEFMRVEKDKPLYEEGLLVGPYSAGDAAITINAAARQGASAAVVGVTGNDDFAVLYKRTLLSGGVDISRVRSIPGEMTGISIVAGFSDGSRSFVFAVQNSAARFMNIADAPQSLLDDTRSIHLSGYTLSVLPDALELFNNILSRLSRDVIVSFDPNYRKEVIGRDAFKSMCTKILERCDVLLASAGEAGAAYGMDDLDACLVAAKNGKLVARKDGENGAMLFDGETVYKAEPCDIVAVDPTGAGDTFGGTMIYSLLRGDEPIRAFTLANAAGALAATRRGLMEIAPSLDEVKTLAKRSVVHKIS
jgi:sugar/nucleoside kinase (ribokinase family)